MAAIVSEKLATVRRLEAAGFRSWPAASVSYNGTWALRLTAYHPSKRLNSINPLDPADMGNLAARVKAAAHHMRYAGRQPIFRISPLAAPELIEYLNHSGWDEFERASVLEMALSKYSFNDVIDQPVLSDLNEFAEAAMRVHGYPVDFQNDYRKMIGAIRVATGCFVLKDESGPISTAMCTQDGELAGLCEVATIVHRRGEGAARSLIRQALKWAVSHGARKAWLQVRLDNLPALALYKSMGFTEAYQYSYYRHSGNEGR